MEEQTPELLKDCRIKVKHLTNSLAQVEAWVNAVRIALNGLDPNMEIQLDPRDCVKWQPVAGPIITHMSCPPPD